MKLLKIITVMLFASFAVSSFAHGHHGTRGSAYCTYDQNGYCGVRSHSHRGYHR